MKPLPILAFALLATASTAETSVPMSLSGGLICDTHEQAVVAIMNPQESTEGCGILRGFSLLGTVTSLEPFEFNGHIFFMSRYDFIVPTPWGNQTQYGFWGPPIPKGAAVETSKHDA